MRRSRHNDSLTKQTATAGEVKGYPFARSLVLGRRGEQEDRFRSSAAHPGRLEAALFVEFYRISRRFRSAFDF